MAQLDVQGSKSSAVVPPGQALPSFFSQKKPMNSPQPEPSTAKAEGAYKTISEVSEELDVPTHVLRFWESRFPQVKPQRMRGSRRYYRPDDVETLRKIKTLLYSQGYTIKGAKKHVKDKAHEIHSAPAEQMAAPVAKQTAPVAKTPAAPAQPIKAKAPSAEVTKLLTELKDLRQKLLSFH